LSYVCPAIVSKLPDFSEPPSNDADAPLHKLLLGADFCGDDVR